MQGSRTEGRGMEGEEEGERERKHFWLVLHAKQRQRRKIKRA